MSRKEGVAIASILVGTVVALCVISGMTIHEKAYEQGSVAGSKAAWERHLELDRTRTGGGKHYFSFHLNEFGVTGVSWADGHSSGWAGQDAKRTGLYWRKAFSNAPDVVYEFIVRRAEITDVREQLDKHVDVVRVFATQTERLLKESEAAQKDVAMQTVDNGDRDGSHDE